ncbi:MAG TPA: LysM domain-containing protein, partial [Anaerolineaceae bacterium]|nr:LysM domain-containing protein [Anaerolineaceae bacterium]
MVFLLAACIPQQTAGISVDLPAPTTTPEIPLSTPLPTRQPYPPGELVDYTAQMGDTLPALAAHFNTTEAEIRTANPIIPGDATTLPSGMPMKIPIYYEPLYGSSYQIIPDSLFVFGPAARDFDPAAFVEGTNGWLKNHSEYVGDERRYGGQLIDYVATNYSISPRVLLALIEYQAGGLSQPVMPEGGYIMGFRGDDRDKEFYQQLLLAANTLNEGYYNWRTGKMTYIDLADGRLERVDPWQNSATVSLHYYFGQFMAKDAYERAIYADGFAKTYRTWFGEPWENVVAHIPGSLQQPYFRLPFLPGNFWNYTGGPHSAWGRGQPWAALDFAPSGNESGCVPTELYTTAVADGLVVRTGNALAVLDLDGDGDERTGWVIFYLHIANETLVPQGAYLMAGDPLGKPSCEGGNATG